MIRVGSAVGYLGSNDIADAPNLAMFVGRAGIVQTMSGRDLDHPIIVKFSRPDGISEEVDCAIDEIIEVV